MSAIYSKIKNTICLHNDCIKKKLSNNGSCVSDGSKVSSGFEEPEDPSIISLTNDVIINVLDANNNNLNIINFEEDIPKQQIVTRTLLNRSDSVSSQPTKRVTYGAMMSRFIDAVNEMNEVVLVPSRLMDIECSEDNEIPIIFEISSGCDMHSGFKLLNAFRNSIVHSRVFSVHKLNYNNETPKLAKQLSVNDKNDKRDFLKELSFDSDYTSFVNDSISRSISSTSSVTMDDCDSSVTDMSDMALNFYHHLHGLNLVLERLIETAKFITRKYEQSI